MILKKLLPRLFLAAAGTDWLINRLDTPGKILVAIGAGHLAGGDSVQSMLAARDFQTKRIH